MTHVCAISFKLCVKYICIGRSWGSLAACNSMLLIIPAARNSILTAGLGIAFDHAVLYHRFIGRFAVLCSLIHGYYYLNYYYRSNYTFITGVGALGCGLIISVTSLNYVRRQLFNLFYWAHYSFVGYLVLAYLHAQQARPFILVGGGLYVADKLLRWVWMSWPRECVEFRTKGDSIVQVCHGWTKGTKILFTLPHVVCIGEIPKKFCYKDFGNASRGSILFC